MKFNYKEQEVVIMCRYGDIYMAKLDEDMEGCLQSGMRPVLVVSNNRANKFSPVISIIPMSSKIKKKNLPTHVLIQNCGLWKPSMVLAEQITALNQSRLQRKIGSIEKTVYEDKDKRALAVQLNLSDEMM
ncbi:MAG TPA: growth inhibitor PemK [Lachnospiraceae bacterium]|nr:growth inhibitor PemK [Lachnospiraceae bacterium]